MQVRWARPTFGTFASLLMLSALCAGIVLGVAGLVASLFGFDPDVMFIIWRFHGVTAGLVGLLAGPLACVLLASLAAIPYPLFRLHVAKSRGIRLSFQAEGDQPLRLSRLQLRSYVKLSAIFAFMLGVVSWAILVLILCPSRPDDISVPLVPLLTISLAHDGVARLALAVLATPFLWSADAAVLGLFAFVPFRLITRVTDAIVPREEVQPPCYMTTEQ